MSPSIDQLIIHLKRISLQTHGVPLSRAGSQASAALRWQVLFKKYFDAYAFLKLIVWNCIHGCAH